MKSIARVSVALMLVGPAVVAAEPAKPTTPTKPTMPVEPPAPPPPPPMQAVMAKEQYRWALAHVYNRQAQAAYYGQGAGGPWAHGLTEKLGPRMPGEAYPDARPVPGDSPKPGAEPAKPTAEPAKPNLFGRRHVASKPVAPAATTPAPVPPAKVAAPVPATPAKAGEVTVTSKPAPVRTFLYRLGIRSERVVGSPAAPAGQPTASLADGLKAKSSVR